MQLLSTRSTVKVSERNACSDLPAFAPEFSAQWPNQTISNLHEPTQKTHKTFHAFGPEPPKRREGPPLAAFRMEPTGRTTIGAKRTSQKGRRKAWLLKSRENISAFFCSEQLQSPMQPPNNIPVIFVGGGSQVHILPCVFKARSTRNERRAPGFSASASPPPWEPVRHVKKEGGALGKSP